jgi:hypothetical protein
VSCREKTKFDAVYSYLFVVGQRFNHEVGTEPLIQDWSCKVVAEVGFVAPFHMISMSVGGNRQVYGLPGVYIEATLLAVNSLIGKLYQAHDTLTKIESLSFFSASASPVH